MSNSTDELGEVWQALRAAHEASEDPEVTPASERAGRGDGRFGATGLQPGHGQLLDRREFREGRRMSLRSRYAKRVQWGAEFLDEHGPQHGLYWYERVPKNDFRPELHFVPSLSSLWGYYPEDFRLLAKEDPAFPTTWLSRFRFGFEYPLWMPYAKREEIRCLMEELWTAEIEKRKLAQIPYELVSGRRMPIPPQPPTSAEKFQAFVSERADFWGRKARGW